MAMRSLFLRLLLCWVSLHPACFNSVRAQSLYFPPNGTNTWETLDPASLGWCPDRIDSLHAFLAARNTKAFLILKDGRIVLEHYVGTFTQDSLWYWASAGKTLTSMLAGIAQEEGFLDIDQPTSAYLGTGWTSASPTQEAMITVRNQLTMTSGLDDGGADDDCTDPACLQYLADAGTRWAYHNGVYTLLDDVIANATGSTFSGYFNTRIRNPIGMDGFWLAAGSPYNNVYFSRARSMARYGLLVLNRGIWNTDTILHDQDYFTAMTTPSQMLNQSYGHLWWLNGQPSFMLPGTQFVFPGPLTPNAPADMISGIGKNDQLISVIPSRNMVVVRMGNAADSDFPVPVVFVNQLWEKINELECANVMQEPDAPTAWYLLDRGRGSVLLNLPGGGGWSVRAIDAMGRVVAHGNDPFTWNLGAHIGEVLLLEAMRGQEVLRDRVVIAP
jgi:CubicO group peptidase (beta-lactamase class C family)